MQAITSARRIFLLALATLASGVPTAGAQIQPPIADERPMALEKHRHTRVDPYFWLRERENHDVIA